MGEHKRYTKHALSLFTGILAVTMLAGCGDDTEDTKEVNTGGDKPTSGQVKEREDFLSQSWDAELVESDSVEEVTIEQVLDGDTIVVTGENGEETVQMALIQSPAYQLEGGATDEGFGYTSYESTNQLIGSSVLLERTDVDNEDGHAVGYVWLPTKPKNELFNETLVTEGLAKVDSSMSDAKYLDRLKDAESKAKAEKKNIWGEDGYVTDNGFNQ